MKLIFLFGPPAVGKLTVARELAELTGFRVFHNHATVDLLLDVFDFGSPSFIKLREEIWLRTMSEAAGSGCSGLIFTFAPERTVSRDFIRRLDSGIKELGGEIFFVELTAMQEEIERRLPDESRAGFKKLRAVEHYRALRSEGAFEFPTPEPHLSVDTARSSPRDAAENIADRLRLRRRQPPR